MKRQSDGKTLDIGVVQPVASPVPDAGGYADAAAQDAFCANTICVINRIYDQSGKGNHLYQAPPGPSFPGPAKGGFDTQPIADMAPITIGGHKAYGVYIMPGMGFRNNDATGIAIDDEPEGIYYVVDGTHYDSGCCFDYGNSSTNGRAVGTGTMETTYFGTSTDWGRGGGPGPWIMADMEAGLFSGYDAKQNVGSPTIDSWRFVTAVVNGGGGNQWDLRGGNAQKGGLTTFYSGIRPGSLTNNAYYPMHKQGAILLGIGGDNGNGSAGTFYEGVMTTGYPTEATTDAVQANIVAARYDVQRVSLSRVTTFTPGSTQEVTVTFTNTTGSPAAGVTVEPVAARGVDRRRPRAPTGASVTFRRPGRAGCERERDLQGHLAGGDRRRIPDRQGRVDGPDDRRTRSETATQRVRNVLPIKINEVRFSTGANSTNQFIELYNASASAVDLSNWTLINTQSQWAPVTLATIPAGTKLASGAYYLLGLSSSGLAAPASPGATTINVRSTTGFEAGQKIDIDGETRTIVERRDGGHGHDDGVHPRVHGAVDHDPRRLDQPACHERGRLRGRPEDRHRHRRQLRTGHGHRGRQGGHANDPVGGGGRGRDQHQGRGQRQHDGRRHADGGHRRTQGTRHGRERRHAWRERHGRRPGGPAQVRPHVGR